MTTEESFLQSSAQGAVKRWVSNKRRTTAQKNGFRKDRTLWHFSAEYHRERTKVVSAVIQCKVDDGRLAVERQRDVDVQPAQQGSEPRGLFLFCEGWDERVGAGIRGVYVSTGKRAMSSCILLRSPSLRKAHVSQCQSIQPVPCSPKAYNPRTYGQLQLQITVYQLLLSPSRSPTSVVSNDSKTKSCQELIWLSRCLLPASRDSPHKSSSTSTGNTIQCLSTLRNSFAL